MLPEEVLGWLLMRRSNLTSQSKLAIQAAAGNSLRFADIERAMRQQEDELLQHERKHGGHGRHSRTYWVESDGSWAVMLAEPEDWDATSDDQVHWVDPDVMAATFAKPEVPREDHEAMWFHDGGFDWTWSDGEWYTLDGENWVSYAEMRPWMDIDEIHYSDAEAAKEAHELYAAFDQKVRSFKEARDLMYNKGKNRGFYQSFKSKGKGKSSSSTSFGKGKKGSAYVSSSGPGKGKGNTPPTARPGYTGCFICGSKEHDYKSCPRRGGNSSKPSSSKPIHSAEAFMVEGAKDLSPEEPHLGDGSPTAAPRSDLQRLILATNEIDYSGLDRLGCAVVDTGATETVGSLDAIDHIMQKRSAVFGQERVDISMSRTKKFRFGNAEEKRSESYLLLPQQVAGHAMSLGVFTLDVPNVPILLGMRTLRKLGAHIDTVQPAMILTRIFPGTRIPLIRATNQHLLLDLCADWTQASIGREVEVFCGTGNLEGSPEENGPRGQARVHDVHVLDDTALSDFSDSSTSDSHGDDPRRVVRLPQGSQERSDGGGETRASPILGTASLAGQEVEPGREQVRLDQGSGSRSPGSTSPEGAVPWKPLAGSVWERLPEWGQRPRMLAGLRVRPQAPLRSPVRVHRDASQPGPPGQGRVREADVQVGASLDLRGAFHAEHCAGCSRTVCDAQAGAHSCQEGGEVQRQGQGCAQDSGRHQGSPQEEHEARSDHSGRGDGRPNSHTGAKSLYPFDSAGGIQPQRSGWGLAEGHPLDEGDEGASGASSAGPPLIPPDRTNLEDDVLMGQGIPEDETEVFLCTRGTAPETKECIRATLETARNDLSDLVLKVRGEGCDLLEVCCGPDSPLTQTISELGGQAYRVGVANDMDMTTTHGHARAKEFANEVRPTWMWFSPICGPTGSNDHMSRKTEKQLHNLHKKHQKFRRTARFCIDLARDQLSRGGQFSWEWPRSTLGWKIPEVRRFFEELESQGVIHNTMLDGCQVGVTSPTSHHPVLKQWKIMTTSVAMHQVLSLRCSGNHVHDEYPVSTCFSYPRKMCKVIGRVMLEPDTQERVGSVFVNDSSQPPFGEQDLKSMRLMIKKIHDRAGHPSNRALSNMLKSRGVDSRVVELAKEHVCDECQEVRLPHPHKTVSLHGTHVLWHTVQVDICQVPYQQEVLHVLLMVDEASRYMAAHELFRTPKSVSRNATSAEVVKALEQTWIQHGLFNTLRSDPEGCFRGKILEEWCDSRGVLHEPCPGEDHGQIGMVESLIGKINEDFRTFMRVNDCDPFVGVLHLVSAHNQMDRVGGYAPCQWAYGRLPTFDNRLFEDGNSLPYHTTEAMLGTDLRANLNLRVKAEELYRKSQAHARIPRALNSKPRPYEVFLPGDLVYYRRYQIPANAKPSHEGVDYAKLGLARWYGPARVLATETRSDIEDRTKRPGSVVWIISSGRLKRTSPQQLRHASEKERLLAEASGAVTVPWTFTSLLHLVERGQFDRFDDLVEDERQPAYRERASRRARSAEVPKPKQPKEPKRGVSERQKTRSEQDAKRARQEAVTPTVRPSVPNRPAHAASPRVAAPAPSHGAGSELAQNKMFQAAVRRAELAESSQPAPHPDSDMTLLDLLHQSKSYVVEDGQPMEDLFELEVPLPATGKEMKSFVRDSETWVSRKMRRNTDMKWHEIPKERHEDFKKAKAKEISNWIREAAVKIVSDKFQVPKHRCMKMRWIYTIKGDGSAKARIVIIGFEDPDLATLHTTSPTMSRRTRGLVLTAAACRGWTVLKGDVRAAFLQGDESETERMVYAKPVVELAESLGGHAGSYVQIAKACYGLANAPAQWHASVSRTMVRSGFEQLLTEPCCWRVLDRTDPENPTLVGVACAHVDDFLFAGDDSSPQWRNAIQALFDAYSWSDWEIDSYMHCGVHVQQVPTGETVLNHADFVHQIEQIRVDSSRSDKDDITDLEKQQLRGALGALQWRVYQTAPQHGARLSFLQSQISRPSVGTLRECNKLIREVWAGRNVGLRYQSLGVTNLAAVQFVCWSDAAVGNRRDLSSTGGFFVAAAEPGISLGRPSKLNPIAWKAGRLPRVARSSLSAEIQAFSVAEEELMYTRLQWLEMIGYDVPLNHPTSILRHSPGILVTDARSLYDVVQKGTQTTSGLGLREKYSVLDMLSVLQRLELGHTSTRWVHSNAQLADGLTKHIPNSSLVRVLTEGTWTLVDDPSFTSAKKLKQQRTCPDASVKEYRACEGAKVLGSTSACMPCTEYR